MKGNSVLRWNTAPILALCMCLSGSCRKHVVDARTPETDRIHALSQSEINSVISTGFWVTRTGPCAVCAVRISGPIRVDDHFVRLVDSVLMVSGIMSGPISGSELVRQSSSDSVMIVGQGPRVDQFEITIRPRDGLTWSTVNAEEDVVVAGDEVLKN